MLPKDSGIALGRSVTHAGEGIDMPLETVLEVVLDYKHQVACSFGQAASHYNADAQVQQDCAKDLVAMLKSYHDQLPAGKILEIGCGTGFVTRELIQLGGDRPLNITDISLEMLEFCQRHLAGANPTQPIVFEQLDGEAVEGKQETYAAIISGFAVQWFESPIASLRQLITLLKPGGVLLVSFPSHRSFPEWQAICERLRLPYTANLLPDPQHLSQQLSTDAVRCHWHEKQVCTTHAQAIDFFKGLKRIGAGLPRSPQRLSPQQMKQLIRYWDDQSSGKIQVHHAIAFLAIQRRF